MHEQSYRCTVIVVEENLELRRNFYFSGDVFCKRGSVNPLPVLLLISDNNSHYWINKIQYRYENAFAKLYSQNLQWQSFSTLGLHMESGTSTGTNFLERRTKYPPAPGHDWGITSLTVLKLGSTLKVQNEDLIIGQDCIEKGGFQNKIKDELSEQKLWCADCTFAHKVAILAWRSLGKRKYQRLGKRSFQSYWSPLFCTPRYSPYSMYSRLGAFCAQMQAWLAFLNFRNIPLVFTCWRGLKLVLLLHSLNYRLVWRSIILLCKPCFNYF